MTDRDCARFRELADELALGVLSGAERGEARTHLAGCPNCREYLLELTVVSDNLLALVPGAEPPVGFEDRVLARLGITGRTDPDSPATEPIPVLSPPPGEGQTRPPAPADELGQARNRRRQGSPRWLPIAAAAAAIALVFGFGGWAIGEYGDGGPASTVSASGLLHGTLLTTHHVPLGTVWAWSGQRSWLSMDVDIGQHSGTTVTCQVRQADGKIVTIGSFSLRDGYGYWWAPAPVGPGMTARILDAEGSVIASADLTS